MSKYKCIRCGYETNLLHNFKRHIYKENTCSPLLQDVNLSDYNDVLFNICSHCRKNYKKYSNIESHNKKCLDKIKFDKLYQTIEQLTSKVNEFELMIKEKPSVINQTINNNTINQTNHQTNNLNINIHLNDFDNFSTSHITKDVLFESITDNIVSLDIIPTIFEKIFFDYNVKSNHSLISINLNNKHKIYSYKKNRVEEMSDQDFNKFITDGFDKRYRSTLFGLLGHSYNNLTNEEKQLLTEDEFNLLLSTHTNQDNVPALKNIMKNRDKNDIVEQTWKMLSNEGKIYFSNKLKNYLSYAPDPD